MKRGELTRTLLAVALLGCVPNCSDSGHALGNSHPADSGAADLPLQSGGTIGSGGATGNGGVAASGGTPSTGGTSVATGGAATGGATGTGGTSAPGATSPTGGARATGGTKSTGGAASTGGRNGGGTIGTGGIGASGGTGGTTTAPGSGGVLGSGGSSSSIDAGGMCTLSCDLINPTCCASDGTPRCTYLPYDPANCGACGNTCKGATPYCNSGTCTATPCSLDGSACATGESCCGGACCTTGQICCMANAPVAPAGPRCFTPDATTPTCPGDVPLRSDRNIKKNIVPVDTAAILQKVSKLPISTWTYKTEADGLRHLGPMAQDFRASFGLGDDEHYYYPVDAHGVALASIQALNKLVQLQQEQIRKLERQNTNLARRLNQVERSGRAQNRP